MANEMNDERCEMQHSNMISQSKRIQEHPADNEKRRNSDGR